MKEKIVTILKVVKRFRFFILFTIIILSLNTYAWFVYITRVDTSFTAKVRSWNVMFQLHNNNISSEVYFTVGNIYPGMPMYSDHASVVNTGETSGEVIFDIKRVQIFNEVYTSDDYTNQQLYSILYNNYPFRINLYLTNSVVAPGHTELFKIDVTWPYESGDDALDTYWGMKAYDYLQNSQTTTCISVAVELKANQEQSS